MTLSDLLATAARDALAFADLLECLAPAQRQAPTPCAGWTIDDLATHVAVVCFRDAEAFHRARIQTSTPPGELTLVNPDLPDAIRLGVAHLRAAFDQAPDRWPVIPTPFGEFPVAAALRSLILEFGVHLDDLKIARGDRRPTLSPATVDALFGFGELFLLRQAQPVESRPVTLRLTAPSKSMAITWTGTHWVAGAGADEHRVEGSDDTIARLMLRRVAADDLVAAAIRPL
ncbi:maleylpyruvate isomerase family mycothiol-dependent enzyme [Mycobacterium sp. TNTM28]|uniref:Maleylpyruvate isomerase family mycothiol-dependent enzyme n=1 Tax=[Mycobacterium] fortunisiensis TaxID=2600579 RepID=A0ABS6KRU0_9MYCO|nr:maleylpyruvate isomerase family mycothiol-dependent enzyme [[Mycobacterium] fortunisiensis]MBU9766204.1 maleylpyruvate isomerase family mycothiol-dependent enzyme [[Mycobacterium] fortunisiensis]